MTNMSNGDELVHSFINLDKKKFAYCNINGILMFNTKYKKFSNKILRSPETLTNKPVLV